MGDADPSQAADGLWWDTITHSTSQPTQDPLAGLTVDPSAAHVAPSRYRELFVQPHFLLGS